MTIEDLQRASELVEELDSGLREQTENLVSLRASLLNYQKFLQEQIKKAREAERRSEEFIDENFPAVVDIEATKEAG